MGIIRPDQAVIVTTAKIGGDARDHFQRAQLARKPDFDLEDIWNSGGASSEIRYVEGIETLRKSVEELATAIYRSDALRILGEILPLAAMEPRSLLSALERPPSRALVLEPIGRPLLEGGVAVDPEGQAREEDISVQALSTESSGPHGSASRTR
jgi:hypothetical protein